MVEQHMDVMEAQHIKREADEKIASEKEEKNRKFWEDLEKSEDPYDNLDAFASYIHDNIGSTTVYIG